MTFAERTRVMMHLNLIAALMLVTCGYVSFADAQTTLCVRDGKMRPCEKKQPSAGVTIGPAIPVERVSVLSVSQGECIQRLATAHKVGLIRSYRMDDHVLTLTVDENAWSRISHDTKLGMIDTTACALLGTGETLSSSVLRSDLTNNIIGQWRSGQLEVK